MRQTKSTAIIYGMIHFLVDFCCAFFMFSISGRIENFYIGLLIYNFLAFAMQMPIGLLADRLRQNFYTAGLGCLLVFVALVLTSCKSVFGEQVILWTGLVLMGSGNCLFHVGGGIEVMKKSKDMATPLGIFVSPGAIGIFLGTILGKQGHLLPMILLCLLVTVTAGLFLRRKNPGKPAEEKILNVAYITQQSKTGEGDMCFVSYKAIGALFCFFLVVAVRSYLGMIITFPWKDTMADSLFLLCAVVGGKLAGGLLADRCGVKRAAMGTLFLAAILFCFSENMGAGILALFLFNMSMPITLYLATKVLYGQNGFAFGILTFAIFMGFLPAYGGYQACNNMILAILTVVSFLFLGTGVLMYERIDCVWKLQKRMCEERKEKAK